MKKQYAAAAGIFCAFAGTLVAGTALSSDSGGVILAFNAKMMESSRMLVFGGLLNILYSFLLGAWLGAVRKNGEETSPIEDHKWLLTGHHVSLLDGLFLLVLAFAILFADLSVTTSKVAAWMLNIGCLFQSSQGVCNYLFHVDDQMKDQSMGWIFGIVQTVLNLPGLCIIIVGFLKAL